MVPIIAGAVGGFAFLVLLVLGAIYARRQRKKRFVTAPYGKPDAGMVVNRMFLPPSVAKAQQPQYEEVAPPPRHLRPVSLSSTGGDYASLAYPHHKEETDVDDLAAGVHSAGGGYDTVAQSELYFSGAQAAGMGGYDTVALSAAYDTVQGGTLQRAPKENKAAMYALVE